MGKLIDLTGQKFGRLTVLQRAKNYVSPKGNVRAQWLCLCDCGNKVTVNTTSLKCGKTISCGCFHSEFVSNKYKKYNTYDLSGEYGIGYTSNGKEFWFDLEDYDKIKSICWRIDNSGYVVGRDCNSKKDVRIHRLVTNCPNDMLVDHIHGESTRHDNRKQNLRICTHCENKRNVNLQSNNTSGVTGVRWDNKNKKWMSYITINQKMINLGRYDDFDDAVNVRIDAENKYFGEYSYKNSQNI